MTSTPSSPSTFAFFNFTCGNFTSGTGYTQAGSKVGLANQIYEALENDGERDCKVIFETMTELDGSDREYDEHQFRGTNPKGPLYEGVVYRVTNRWHTHLVKMVPVAAPFIGKYLMDTFGKALDNKN